MDTTLTLPTLRATTIAMGFALAAGLFVACAAWGQERHDGRGREMRQPYRTPHVFFDDRYRHGHYYPVVGYGVVALPPGYLSIGFGNRRFFFQGGVWFQQATSGFVVIRPPLGVVVPVLPSAYTMVWVAGAPYYYANDIYYVEAPSGYAVAAPPAGIAQSTAPPVPPALPTPVPQQSPPVPPATAPPQATAQVWYYCESSQSYYPYAAECKEGWRTVPATPPGTR